mmetsp:Transcript_52998/g.104586  ORF Transcript_52998/g.104586 Transcript_52998/m.104586 type:complete len:255 (+) Transcript_52998:94-858(+)
MELSQRILDLLHHRKLSDDAHSQCVKVFVLINSQIPRIQQADTNEVAETFAKMDSGEAGDNISQDLLHLLNEVGYPNIHGAETIPAVRIFRDVLNVEPLEVQDNIVKWQSEDGMVQNSLCSDNPHHARGHFYTNDVKVLVDIIIRELRNIPHNTSGLIATRLELVGCHRRSGCARNSGSTADQIASVLHGQIRYVYLELLDAVVSKSTWSSLGECYMKDTLRELLEDILTKREGDEKSHDFALGLLEKYCYYLN